MDVDRLSFFQDEANPAERHAHPPGPTAGRSGSQAPGGGPTLVGFGDGEGGGREKKDGDEVSLI